MFKKMCFLIVAFVCLNAGIVPQLFANENGKARSHVDRAKTAACVALGMLYAAGGLVGGICYSAGNVGPAHSDAPQDSQAIPFARVVVGNNNFPEMGCEVKATALFDSDGSYSANVSDVGSCSFFVRLGRSGSCSVGNVSGASCTTPSSPWAPSIVIGDDRSSSNCAVRCVGAASSHPGDPDFTCDSQWACTNYVAPGAICEVAESQLGDLKCSLSDKESG